MKRVFIFLFITHLITRLVFVLAVGIHEHYALQSDSTWLVNFADQALAGNFDFQFQRFIASPLFSLVCAAFKFLFGTHWDMPLMIFQLLLSATSGIYIYKITFLLFKNDNTALLASLLFAVFPMTFWFVNTFSQECLFQSLLIFTIYYLLKSLQSRGMRYVILSAVLFSLLYLTKSHILIFALFIPLIYFHRFRFSGKTFSYSLVFASVAMLFSLPYGIYHLKKNGVYVISSNGAGYQFYLGNTEAGYRTVVKVPEQGTEEFRKLQDISGYAGYFNGSQERYDSLLAIPQKIKQKVFFSEALAWIKNNPAKFFELKLYDAAFFLMPGVSFRHYRFSMWIITFVLCLPIYMLAYISILRENRKNFLNNVVINYLFLTMFLFSTVWYVQNRFRTITLDPFYLIYAAAVIYRVIEKSQLAGRFFGRIALFYGGGKPENIV